MNLVASIYGSVVFVLFLLTDAKALGGTQGMLRRPNVPNDTNTKAPISVSFQFPFSVSLMQSFAQEVFGKLVTCKSEVDDWLGGFCPPFKTEELPR